MKFFKLFGYDVVSGIKHRYKMYVAVFCICLVLCTGFYIQLCAHISFRDVSSSIMDYFIFLFQGMKVYKPSDGEPFIFPAVWMIIHLLLAYSTLYYCYSNLHDHGGQNILVRTGGRWCWWLSKCIWNITSVCVFFLILYGTVCVFCFITGVSFSSNATPEILSGVLEIENSVIPEKNTLQMVFFLMPICISIGVSLLQMALSLLIKPFYSFMVTAIIYLSSAYFVSPLLIGNYSMLLRQQIYVENGVHGHTGFILSAAIALLSVVIGGAYFKRYDVLKQE